MSQDNTGHFLSRRAYLGAVGLTTLSTVPGISSAASDYGTVVDIVEAGADDTGREPIDDVFDDVKGDDTLVKFPSGTYKANSLIVYQLNHFAMVGEGDVTLVPGENYDSDLWLAGAETRDVRIENFTFDHTGDVDPEVDLGTYGGLVLRDITKHGAHDGDISFGIRVYDSGTSALLENVVATDGGDSVCIYLTGDGKTTVRDCHIEGFADNGLYGSRASGPVVVEGGQFRNNNVAQVRLGSEGSAVRDATITVDEAKDFDGEAVNMRGIRVSGGPGPVSIENCNISMEAGEGAGGIVGAYSGGSFDVSDTRIYVGENYTTTGSDGSRTSYGIYVDNNSDAPTGSRTFDGVSITGGGTYRAAMRFRRGNNTIKNCCIHQTGTGRDGLHFQGSTNNSLSNSTVDVTDETIREEGGSSVEVSGIDTSGSCPLPSQRGGGGGGGDSGGNDETTIAFETGVQETSQWNTDRWYDVYLDRSYDDPVALMKPPTANGVDPMHLRLANVSRGSFIYKLEEWQYDSGTHTTERMNYVVAEGGAGTLAGLTADVGTFETNHEFHSVGFDADFDATPVVLTQSQTYEGSDPIVTRPRNVSADGMAVRLQEQDEPATSKYHYLERVGYFAVEPGTGMVDGNQFEAGRTPEAVDENWYTIEFENSYDDPQFLADVQTYEGWNSVTLRYRNLTSDSVDVYLQEDTSADPETGHLNEVVGYVVFEG